MLLPKGRYMKTILVVPTRMEKGFSGPVACAFAGAGDEADKFAIKIASDEKGVFILSAGSYCLRVHIVCGRGGEGLN